MSKVFALLEQYRVPVDMMATTEQALSLAIETDRLSDPLQNELCQLGVVEREDYLSIVCVVGDLEWENLGYQARIIQALQSIPLRMISYGGSHYNLSVLVATSDKTQTLKSLSHHLFSI